MMMYINNTIANVIILSCMEPSAKRTGPNPKKVTKINIITMKA
jgi:hypothetical protein